MLTKPTVAYLTNIAHPFNKGLKPLVNTHITPRSTPYQTHNNICHQAEFFALSGSPQA